MTKEQRNYIGIAGIMLVLFIMILSYISVNNKDKREGLQNTVDVLNNSVSTLKLADGRNVSTITAFSSTNTKLLRQLDSKDSSINVLQSEVKRYKKELKNGGSVVVVSGTTSVSGTVPTIPVEPQIPNNTPTPQKPAYSFSFTDEWIQLTGISKSDSTSFNLAVVNKYTVAVGIEKRKPFVEVTNSNPYTTVKTLRAFLTDFPKPKRFGIGIQAGYGASKDGLSPYIGAGISYNFIRF